MAEAILGERAAGSDGAEGTRLHPADPWDGPLAAPRYGKPGDAPGLTFEPLAHATTVVFSLPAGGEEAFARAVKEHLGIKLPPAGQWRACEVPRADGSASEGWKLAWDGPERWRLVGPGDATPRAVQAIKSRMLESAAGVDQSHGQAVLRIGGAAALDLLARGTSMDVRASAFPTGSSAPVLMAHHSVHLMRLDDEPTFELAVGRSMVGSFADWLISAAAPFGAVVER